MVCDTPVEVELHAFSDASEKAYAAVCYWRFLLPKISICLIASKSRVTPLRPVSIPRLELQAAVLGARLANTIVEEHDLKPTRRVFWTDSATTLAWIKSDPRGYKTFVANRLGEIDELTVQAEWRWVPTKQNPADIATRENVTCLSDQDEWFKGPNFLLDSEEHWPKSPLIKVSADDSERKSEMTLTITVKPLVLPDPCRFSSWNKLINATAYVLLFIDSCRTRVRQTLSVEFKHKAERVWIKQVQRQCYPRELACLMEGKPIPLESSLIQVSPFLDNDGFMRVRGRIGVVEGVAMSAKQPLILGKHPYTNLLLHDFHQCYQHGSTETVLNEVRQRYWVPSLRAKLRFVAHRCQWCRVKKAQPSSPPMGDLPAVRLDHHKRPFTHCGLDYFGPVEITVRRSREKRYVALFTCLTTRAVHLEVVVNLTTDSVIMAMRRMMARRGCPATIHSDNGTNFHGADHELRAAWLEIDQEVVGRRMLNYGIIWSFIPPSAPHMGGSWERLVQNVKRTLAVTLKSRAPKEEILHTLVTEAEHIVNSRPLTYVSTNPEDPEAITPNHFLLGSSSGVPVPGVFGDYDLYRRRDWRISQRLADIFWERWVKEYLPTLLTREKNTAQSKDLKPGDIVIVVDHRFPRNTWPKGKVTAVIPGTDGRVRVVDVETQQGVYRRPATKIIPLPTENV